MKCALLPKRALHKFDDHPLELITSSSSSEHHQHHDDDDELITSSSSSEHHQHDDDDDKYYCEFCEKEIDRNYWYYGCVMCEQYFHINCIPSVGYLSKVKFGKILVDDSIHSHPLALTRMLTVGRHERCGYCKQIIRGFVDEMAFRCSHDDSCDFWIHFSCAWDSSRKPSTLSKPYWEVEEELAESFRAKGSVAYRSSHRRRRHRPMRGSGELE